MSSHSNSTRPTLPIDVIEKIMETLWLSSLSISDRTIFIKSSLLVSRSWMRIFTRLASIDAFVLGPTHCSVFAMILQKETFLARAGYYMHERICRSITFQHARTSLLPAPMQYIELPMIYSLNGVMHLLASRSSSRLPRLRRIVIHLENYLMESFFMPGAFRYFPSQVNDLELNFTYPRDTTEKVKHAIRHDRTRLVSPVPGSLPHITRLKVTGSSRGALLQMAKACSAVERRNIEQDAMLQNALGVTTSRDLHR